MFSIEKEVELDMGHRVPFHDSKCKNIHGHRYKVRAYVSADEVVPDEDRVSDSGMVMDFGVIKDVLMKVVHDPFDHKLCLWGEDPVGYHSSFLFVEQQFGLEVMRIDVVPTAENLAKYWYWLVYEEFLVQGFRGTLDALRVYETPTSTALYFPK